VVPFCYDNQLPLAARRESQLQEAMLQSFTEDTSQEQDSMNKNTVI